MGDAIYWAGRLHLVLDVGQCQRMALWWLVSNNPDNRGLPLLNGSQPRSVCNNRPIQSFFVRPNNYRLSGQLHNPYAVLAVPTQDPVTGSFAIVIANTNSAATARSFYFAISRQRLCHAVDHILKSLARRKRPFLAVGSTFSYAISCHECRHLCWDSADQWDGSSTDA